MKLYYIRHGQSENNALYDLYGDSQGRLEDPPLTATGQRQAQALVGFIQQKDLKGQAGDTPQLKKRDFFGFTHLYTSLMVRAVQTAHALAGAVNLTPVAWPDIHETGGMHLADEISGENLGRPGKGRSYFEENFNSLILPESISDEGWWNRPFERDEECQPRARRVLQELLARHGGTHDRVAFVSHGGFYVHLMREIFAIQGANIWLHMFNTGITRVDFRPDGRANLIYHDRTDHLPEELLT